ncbi:hypothetical protein GCM10023336_40330 [Streptomyces similanensis]|uniref:Uncharacterized protein n=1 Tax=Streptomyces similanensis TaxID=1274988 RepID=A0ABP9KN70_9ACTN
MEWSIHSEPALWSGGYPYTRATISRRREAAAPAAGRQGLGAVGRPSGRKSPSREREAATRRSSGAPDRAGSRGWGCGCGAAAVVSEDVAGQGGGPVPEDGQGAGRRPASLL